MDKYYNYSQFHEDIRKAKNKQEMLNSAIKALSAFAGAFNDAPDVYKKMKGKNNG